MLKVAEEVNCFLLHLTGMRLPEFLSRKFRIMPVLRLVRHRFPASRFQLQTERRHLVLPAPCVNAGLLFQGLFQGLELSAFHLFKGTDYSLDVEGLQFLTAL
jgi:hypothetical protein